MAILKNTTIDDSEFLQLPVGTTAQRPDSPQNGDMRYNSELKVVEQYEGNTWKYVPPIIENGLVLHLDAAEPASYPGSGTTWFDLSGNGFHSYGSDLTGGSSGEDISRFPEWQSNNGGRFFWDGSKALNISQNMGNYSQGTHEVVLWRTDLSSSSLYISDARNGTGNWWLTNYLEKNINIHDTLWINDPISYTNNSNLWGKWIHLVMSSDGEISRCFIDGDEITDQRRQRNNPINMNLGTNFRIGNRFTGSGRWQGYMSVFRIYNRSLSPSEIKQNFNALRGRYGI